MDWFFAADPLIKAMLAGSFTWSLTAWSAAAIGFLAGGLFLFGVDRLLPHLNMNSPVADCRPSGWKRSVLLVIAITLHNIPEGLAVGVAAAGLPSATLAGALALALGIGLQNFPEGAAVSVPLRREGLSRRRSFFAG